MPLICVAGPGSRYYAPAAAPGGGEYYGLTPERYVSATGSGSDNGLTEGTPWDWTQYLAGGANLITGALPGTFTGTTTGSNSVPVFNPPSGSIGDPTILVCKYPAAYNVTNRTEFRNGVTTGDTGCVTIGLSGRSYAQVIGAYVDENVSRSASDTGPIGMDTCDNCLIEACRVDGITITRGDNHTGIRLEGLDNCTAKNNVVTGIKDTGGSQNHAGILAYSCRSVIIEHNDISACDVGIFLKGESAGDGEIGNLTVRWNKISNVTFYGLSWGGPNSVLTLAGNECYGNLCDGAYAMVAFYVFGDSADSDGPAEINFHHNTGVNIQADEGVTYAHDPITPGSAESYTDTSIRDNLFHIDGAGLGHNFLWALANNATVAARGFAVDYNGMFGFSNWGNIGGNYATRAAWFTGTGYDQNSTTLTGDPFTNLAGGDFTLNDTAGAGAAAKTASSTGGHIGYTGSGGTPGLE